MLAVKPFRQKPSYCGPASLKMVLDYFGVQKSESELGKMAGTTFEKGTSAQALMSAAHKLGFEAFVKDGSTLKDLHKYVVEKQIPVIVNWFSTDEGHYSPVVWIDKKYIYLQDPELAKIRKIEIKTFENIWFDFMEHFPKGKRTPIFQRMIVVSPVNKKPR